MSRDHLTLQRKSQDEHTDHGFRLPPKQAPEAMSKKRRRESASIDTQLVEIYEDLANENEEIRLKAASSLLAKVSPEKSPSREQLSEILTRLTRGLCSGRKAARLGFSVALTEYLVQTRGSDGAPQLDVQEVIDVLKKQTVAVGDASGNACLTFLVHRFRKLTTIQEARDHDYGRLFGAEAIIKSGIIFRAGASIDCWKQILDLILELAKKRTWLRRECGWVLYKTVELLDKPGDFAYMLLKKFSEHGLSKTPEGLATWLEALSAGSRFELPDGVWYQNDPLHPKNKESLANLLKQSTPTKSDQQDDVDRVSQTGNWSPSLHFAWDVVIANLLGQENAQYAEHEKYVKHVTFEDFWRDVVDDGLFSTSSSNERKFWGFLLFQRLIRRASAAVLPTIFSENLVRCLLNQLASPERYLHQNAQRTMSAIFKRMDHESTVSLTVLNGLVLLPARTIGFHQVTKSKIMEKLLAHVSDESLVDFLPSFSKMLAKPNEMLAKQSEKVERAAATTRQLVADQLVATVKLKLAKANSDPGKLLRSDLLIGSLLKLLAEHAYFIREQSSLASELVIDPPMSEASRDMLKSRISSCLNVVLVKCAKPVHVSYDLIQAIHAMEQKEDTLKPLFESEEAIRKTIGQAWVTLEKIHCKGLSASGSRTQLLGAFELLYSLTFLEIYNGEADAVGVLDELKISFDDLLKPKQNSHEGGSDGLVEILLSFVSKPSMLFRQMAQQVFSACTSNVTSRGLQSMVKVLETAESFAGRKEIFDQEDESAPEGSGEDELSDVSDGSIVENEPNGIDLDNTKDLPAGSGDEAADEELAAFNAKLALALGTRPATDDLAADDSEQSSDEDMNDEQMEALDEHLEKVFRERKNIKSKKSQNKEVKEAIVNFKCRVLDLLDIYVKQQCTNPLTLDLLVPLLEVIDTTKSPLVSTKACNVLRNYSKLCKSNSVPPVSDLDATMGMLRDVHQRASKEASNAHAAACSQASLLLVKALSAQDRENLRLVESVYGETHLRFMLDPKIKTKPQFFTDWLNWSVSARGA